MLRLIRHCPIALVFLTTICAPSQGQTIQVGSFTDDAKGGFLNHWDSANVRLILYRDTVDTNIRGVRVIGVDGTNFGLYPQRDLAEAQFLDIWAVAGTPGRGFVLSVVAGYSPPGEKPFHVRPLLLTYTSSGTLEQVWNVKPYHFHQLAVNKEGNVFALGDRDENHPYPLIVEYSSTGQVLREFLNSDTFSDGSKILANGSLYGDSHMFITSDRLFVWSGPSRELLQFSLAGELLSRSSFAGVLDRLALDASAKNTKVRAIAVSMEDGVVAQIQLWPQQVGDHVRTMMVQMPLDGSRADIRPQTAATGVFLDIASSGRLLFLDAQSDGRASEVTVR